MIPSLAPSLDVLILILLGGFVAAALVLLVVALTPTEVEVQHDRPGWPTAPIRRLGARAPLAVLAALGVLLITGWTVAAVAAAAMALAWPALFGGARAQRRASARIESLAVWTESLRDTIAGAVGLEQAILATAQAPPEPIARELQALADRLRVRTNLPQALRRFADDLDDASADLIVATLMLNAGLRGPGLRQVLTSLAEAARAELDMRARVGAGRASTRRSVQIVVGVTVSFVLALAVFNPDYVKPYSSFTGQAVLLVVVGLFAGGFFWLRRLSSVEMPGRFLSPDPQTLGTIR